MTAAITSSISQIASNLCFAPRRVNHGLEDSHAPVSLMYLGIAGAQTAKIADSIFELSKNSNNSIANAIKGTRESIQEATKTDAVMKQLKPIASFAKRNVNGLICGAGALSILCADDKVSEAIDQGLTLPFMFAFEGATKNILGMSKTEFVNGEKKIVERKALYKEIFSDSQKKAINDYLATSNLAKKATETAKEVVMKYPALKYAPPALKGFFFVGMSITGCLTGHAIAKGINESRNKAKEVKMVKQAAPVQAA